MCSDIKLRRVRFFSIASFSQSPCGGVGDLKGDLAMKDDLAMVRRYGRSMVSTLRAFREAIPLQRGG